MADVKFIPSGEGPQLNQQNANVTRIPAGQIPLVPQTTSQRVFFPTGPTTSEIVGDIAREIVISPIRELARVSFGGLLSPFLTDEELENVPILGDISPPETFSEAFGGAGEVALTFLPLGKAVGATKNILTGTTKATSKEFLKTGVKTGLLGTGFSVSEALQQNLTVAETIDEAGVGFGLGFGLGIFGKGVGEGVKKLRAQVPKIRKIFNSDGSFNKAINTTKATIHDTFHGLDNIPIKEPKLPILKKAKKTLAPVLEGSVEVKDIVSRNMLSPKYILSKSKGGSKILDMVNKVDRFAERSTAKTIELLRKAGMNQLTTKTKFGRKAGMNELKYAIHDYLDQGLANPKVEKLFGETRKAMDDIVDAANSEYTKRVTKIEDQIARFKRAGAEEKVLKSEARLKKLIEEQRGVQVNYRKNFFPHQVPAPEILLKDNQVTKDIIANNVRLGRFPDAKTAKDEMHKFANFMKSKKGEVPQSIIDNVRRNAPDLTDDEARGMILSFRRAYNSGNFSGFKARVQDIPFYDPDYVRVVPRYLEGAYRAVAKNQVYGISNHRVAAAVRNIALEKGQQDAEFAKEFLRIHNKRVTDATGVNKLFAYIRGFEVASKLDFATFANATQSVNTLLKGDLPSMFSALKQLRTKEGQEFVRRSGAILDRIIENNPEILGGGRAGKILNFSGFNNVERFNRSLAALTGKNYAQIALARLRKSPGDKRARDFLKSLFPFSKTDDEVARMVQKGFSDDEILDIGAKFAADTQFVIKAQNVPIWAKTGWGQLAFQFKSFAFNQLNFLIDQTFKELGRGNYTKAARNFAVIGLVFPVVGEAKEALRNLIVGRVREEQPALERWKDNIAAIGAFGMASDFINAAGFGKTAEFLLGPAGSDFTALANNILGKAKWDTKKKKIYKQAIQAVPFADPFFNRLFPSATQQRIREQQRGPGVQVPFTGIPLFR